MVNYYHMYPDSPKIHLAVLCARNTEKKKQLERIFATLDHPRITVDVIGWADEEELAKLNAMGADPKMRGALVSTKGGGGTLSEGLASGIPMLLGSSDDIEWEKINIDEVCERGCGLRFQGESDIMERLFELFDMPYHRIEIDSKGESMRLTQEQIQAAEADETFQGFRKEALSFRPPALNDI
jgi:UDP-N-acetylglucosamine:LPS N-acetylglucosamine transferase